MKRRRGGHSEMDAPYLDAEFEKVLQTHLTILLCAAVFCCGIAAGGDLCMLLLNQLNQGILKNLGKIDIQSKSFLV